MKLSRGMKVKKTSLKKNTWDKSYDLTNAANIDIIKYFWSVHIDTMLMAANECADDCNYNVSVVKPVWTGCYLRHLAVQIIRWTRDERRELSDNAGESLEEVPGKTKTK